MKYIKHYEEYEDVIIKPSYKVGDYVYAICKSKNKTYHYYCCEIISFRINKYTLGGTSPNGIKVEEPLYLIEIISQEQEHDDTKFAVPWGVHAPLDTITRFYITEKDIKRLSTPEEIEEYKNKKISLKYNL